MIAPRATPDRSAASRTALPDGPARQEMIRTAAYLLAERRGFSPGQELDDWLAAEREVDRVLAAQAAQRRRYGRAGQALRFRHACLD